MVLDEEFEKLDKEFDSNLKELDRLTDYFTKMAKLYPAQHAMYEKAVTDLYHDIELSSLSGPELMQDTIMLRDALRKKRRYREIAKLLTGAAPRCQSVREALHGYYSNACGRHRYHPRVLQGLKYARTDVERLADALQA